MKNLSIHELIEALLLWNLYGNGVKPVLHVERYIGEDLTSHPNLHFYHGKIVLEFNVSFQEFPVKWFGLYELQEAIWRDFNKYEAEKNLQLSAELSDSNLVISYYVTQSY